MRKKSSAHSHIHGGTSVSGQTGPSGSGSGSGTGTGTDTVTLAVGDLGDLLGLAVPTALGAYGADVARSVELLRQHYPSLSRHARRIVRTAIDTALRSQVIDDGAVRAAHAKHTGMVALAPELLSGFLPPPIFEADWKALLAWMESVEKQT